MAKYFAIVEDVQTYEVWIEVPDGLTEEEVEERIFEELGDNRDKYWKEGQESIVALDKL